MRLLLTALVFFSTRAAAQTPSMPEDVGLDSMRLMRAGNVLETVVSTRTSGSAVGLIARNGQIVFHRAYGELEPGVPMTCRRNHAMASIGKTITAAAIMQLVEEGKVRLSDPVTRFIPEFLPRTVALADSEKGAPLEPKRPITIYDLLTHQSGLAVTGSSVDDLWDKASTTLDFSRGLAKLPLQWQPGEGFEYGMGMKSWPRSLRRPVEQPSTCTCKITSLFLWACRIHSFAYRRKSPDRTPAFTRSAARPT